MNSKVIPVDFLRKKKKETAASSEVVALPSKFSKKEAKEAKLLRLEALIAQGLYEPNLEDVAEALIKRVSSEEGGNPEKS